MPTYLTYKLACFKPTSISLSISYPSSHQQNSLPNSNDTNIYLFTTIMGCGPSKPVPVDKRSIGRPGTFHKGARPLHLSAPPPRQQQHKIPRKPLPKRYKGR